MVEESVESVLIYCEVYDIDREMWHEKLREVGWGWELSVVVGGEEGWDQVRRVLVRFLKDTGLWKRTGYNIGRP